MMEGYTQPLVYSVTEAAEILGISSSLLYREIRSNPLFPRRMIGGRIVIPVQKLELYMNGKE